MKNTTSKYSENTLLIIWFAVMVGVFGASSHLLFWFEMGDIVRYDNAHDESYYLNYLFNYGWAEFYLSWWPQKLMSTTELNVAWLAMLFDMIWPMLFVICAGLLATQITSDRLLVFLFITLYVLGFDLLSFNATLLPQSWALNSVLQSEPAVKQFFVSPFLTYVQIFRSPEPQSSLVFLTCYAVLLLNYTKNQNRQSLVLVLLAACFTSLSYPFYAIASLLLSAGFSFCVFVVWGWRKCLPIVFATLLGILCILMAMSMRTSSVDAFIYYSRLPAISLSMIYGFVAAVLTAVPLYRRGGIRYWQVLTSRDQLFKSFGLLCLLLPTVILNQQVITGRMVLLTHWEKLINYNLFVLGLFLVIASSHRVKLWCKNNNRLNSKFIISTLFVGVIATLVIMTARQYQYWAYANVQATAYASAIKGAVAGNDNIQAETRIFLEKPTRDQLLQIRFDEFELQSMGYLKVLQETFKLDATEKLFNLSGSLPQIGFESAARMGFESDELLASLVRSIDKNSCWPYLAYFFSVRDCSPLQSTFRNYRPDILRSHLGAIGQSYDNYLKKMADGNHASAHQSAIIIKSSADPNYQQKQNRYWRESVVHTETLGYDNRHLLGVKKRFWPVKTYVILQTPLLSKLHKK